MSSLLRVVLQAILALPFLDLAPPRLERRGIRTLRRRLDDLDHLVEHVGDVAHDRHVDLHALADRRRVDVDVDDLAVVAEEVLRVADHAVVEARADGDQHVAVLHRHVRLVRAVHAEHAGELRIGAGKSAQPHQRVRARKAQQAHEARQLRRGVVQDHAAARVDHRPLRLEQQLHRLLDLPGVALGHRVVRAQRHRLRIRELGRRLRHVLRDVDQHRARAGRSRRGRTPS